MTHHVRERHHSRLGLLHNRAPPAIELAGHFITAQVAVLVQAHGERLTVDIVVVVDNVGVVLPGVIASEQLSGRLVLLAVLGHPVDELELTLSLS